MDKKLTLALDGAVIDAAKEFADENNTSLSRLVEGYFFSLTVKKHNGKKNQAIHPSVRALTGILPAWSDEELDQVKFEYLHKKHLS